MGYRDHLKYDVLKTFENNVSVSPKPVASFSSRELALAFLKRYASNVIETPFTYERDSGAPLFDLVYDGANTILFHDPRHDLWSMREIAPNTTKETMVKRVIVSQFAQFDYALPQTWLDDVVKRLSETMYEDRARLYQIITFGTVWFYPANGYGRVSGRPLALIQEAENALVEYTELT